VKNARAAGVAPASMTAGEARRGHIRARAARGFGVAADYLALAKPRLNLLVVVTSAAGYYLGAPGPVALGPMAAAAVGTALVACGAAALNQLAERDTDALMERTRTRPLPGRRIAPEEARVFGLALSAVGVALLAIEANALSALLAVATLVVYLWVYTPMKRRSPAATLVGAVPGALPPLIGWVAARNAATLGGWTLFAIVFLWQVPHFMAIAWMYRDDYARAGFPLLSVIEPDGHRLGRQAVMYTSALVPVTLLPTAIGVAGWIYFAVALVLGAALLAIAARFAVSRTDRAARQLFYASITYLPLLWAAMILD
jgi:protoheme IX farnesyltransferase